jgi:DNA-binding PucR family transcriptional regulator
VHRNTGAARVARIQQLLGVDLATPDERLALHLACRTLGRQFDWPARPQPSG